MKHQWADPVRWDMHTTYRGCQRCGITRITRHEAFPPWTEYERGHDGARIHTSDGRVPQCEEKR